MASTPVSRRAVNRPRASDTVSAGPCKLGSKQASGDVVTVPLCGGDEQNLFWLYVSRIQPDVKEDAVKSMVEANLNTDNVSVIILVPKGSDVSNFRFISFKVGLSPELKSKALNSETWPDGLFFREFVNYGQFRAPMQ